MSDMNCAHKPLLVGNDDWADICTGLLNIVWDDFQSMDIEYIHKTDEKDFCETSEKVVNKRYSETCTNYWTFSKC